MYLRLRNQTIANDSQINIRSIGESSDNPNSPLLCITDKIPCCFNLTHRHGEWYLPNATMIDRYTSAMTYYRSRGDDGEVILNHPNNVTSPTGRFCCKVPDANDIIQTLCVIIGMLVCSIKYWHEA